MKNQLHPAIALFNNKEIFPSNHKFSLNEITEYLKISETFLNIVDKINSTKKSDNFPDSVYYTKGDSIYIEHQLKTNLCIIRYDGFLSEIEKNGYCYISNMEILKSLLSGFLGCNINNVVGYVGFPSTELEKSLYTCKKLK